MIATLPRVSPPLKWHGGKHYLAAKIVALMPEHTHYKPIPHVEQMKGLAEALEKAGRK